MKLYIKEFYKEQPKIQIKFIDGLESAWTVYITIDNTNYYFGVKGYWHKNLSMAFFFSHYSQTKYFADQLKTIDTPHIIKE